MLNYVKTGILLVVLTMLLIWIGDMIGGPRGALIAFTIALLINGVSYWFSDKIVLAMYRAYEIPKDRFRHLYAMVNELAVRAGIPMPRLYMTDIGAANAFATGRSPEHACVCLTRGILELLNENELKGVIAHEMGHIKNRDTLIMTVAAAIAGAVMMLANVIRWTAILGGGSRGGRNDSGNVLGLIALSIIAPIAALLIQLAISRSREYGADAAGAKIAAETRGLEHALEKLSMAARYHGFKANPETAHLFIVNPFKGNFIANLFATHPPVSARIKRLQAIKV